MSNNYVIVDYSSKVILLIWNKQFKFFFLNHQNELFKNKFGLEHIGSSFIAALTIVLKLFKSPFCDGTI